MEKILVSSCLMGAPVRYDGHAKTLNDQLLATWRAQGRLVALCPEMAAGLPTPRPAAEIEPGAAARDVLASRAHVIDAKGTSMSEAFVRGADLALEAARENACRFALLIDGSPSCGSSYVYNGHFSGQRQSGEGVVAARLRDAGVQVFAPDQLHDLAVALDTAENRPA